MLKYFCRHLVWFVLGICLLWGFVAVIWGASGFPMTGKICQHTAYGAEYDCHTYDIREFVLWKTYDAVFNLTFIVGLITAIATAYIARFTWALKRSTDNLWNATKDSLSIARQEFIASHRPKIIVYGFDVQFPIQGNARKRIAAPAQFRYVNSGDTEAFITEIGTKIICCQSDRPKPGIEFFSNKIEPPIQVMSGAHGFRMSKETLEPLAIHLAGDGGSDNVFCVGYIIYKDSNKTIRQTGFCRRYDAATERWLIIQDDDYEYNY